VTYAKSLVSNGINRVLLGFQSSSIRILGIAGAPGEAIGGSLMIWTR